MKRRKYLWALTLAGMLMVGNVPLAVHATSINAGATIVDSGGNANAGNTLNVGTGGAPAAEAPAAEAQIADLPAAEAPEEVSVPEADVPAAGAPEQGNQETSSIQDDETPLAVLAEGAKTEKGIPVAVVTVGVIATVGFMVVAGRKKENKQDK